MLSIFNAAFTPHIERALIAHAAKRWRNWQSSNCHQHDQRKHS